MQKAIEYIKNNWQKGKNLKEIANEFGIDPGNLERSFTNSHGATVKHFIDEKRKDYILTHIGKDDVYGYEIGEILGFKNERAFYRWVKYTFGISYRKLLVKQQNNTK